MLSLRRALSEVVVAGPRLPKSLSNALHRLGILPSRFLLTVSVAEQSMKVFTLTTHYQLSSANYAFRKGYRVSTSAYGIGQKENSNQTPLGLHRIATKVGGGWPVGTVFKGRQPVGFTWQGLPNSKIVHRILWLEGLEPGFNQGGDVDSFKRYIYIHGFGDETTLGHPQSHGCIHLASHDLLPLFDRIPVGTLVWICRD
jgi:hypothetical protein